MRVLTRKDVESLLTINDAIDAVEDGFRQLALGNVQMPQRLATTIPPHNGLHLSMPAFVDREPGTLTTKIITVYPDNPAKHIMPMIQGVLMLYDAENGELLALMDAEHLTAMRTGAASGVATKALAGPDASCVTLFGAGAQAGAQLAAVCAVRPIERAFVVTKTGRHDVAFCLHMEAELGIEVTPAENPRAAVESSDIICTATNSTVPVVNGNWVQDGTHINAVGAYTSSMRELDSSTVQFARVFVDDHAAAKTEAGDILIPVEAGEFGYEHIAGELGEVLLKQVAGRQHETDITIFKSVGLAMQDAVTAEKVYARAVEEGVGQDVEL
jgi:alanine dehydrogenase